MPFIAEARTYNPRGDGRGNYPELRFTSPLAQMAMPKGTKRFIVC